LRGGGTVVPIMPQLIGLDPSERPGIDEEPRCRFAAR
jgi:hypothetical protein